MVFKFKKKTDKDKSHYLSAQESREIAKKNARTIRELERRKKRIASEDEYTTQMRDENNIVEFDDLHTYFFHGLTDKSGFQCLTDFYMAARQCILVSILLSLYKNFVVLY